jgi:hypothetical protein
VSGCERLPLIIRQLIESPVLILGIILLSWPKSRWHPKS